MKHDLRSRLIESALEWEAAFGVAPAIASALSEYDAAIVLGCSPEAYATGCANRKPASRRHEFVFQNKRYQVKAIRPSGKPGNSVKLVGKPGNYDWDFLIWIHYDRNFVIQEAWLWPVDAYRKAFGSKSHVRSADIRRGKLLFPSPQKHETPQQSPAQPHQPDPVQHAFKRLTEADLLTADSPACFPQISKELWLQETLKPQLSPKVPQDIQAQFECARALFACGYLFLPLCTLAGEQLFRVAEAATTAKCAALGLPHQRVSKSGKPHTFTFAENIGRLARARVIKPSELLWWERTHRLRNVATTPDQPSPMTSDGLLSGIQETAAHITVLFA